jgi:alpha-aminoadipate carrier protein LysW
MLRDIGKQRWYHDSLFVLLEGRRAFFYTQLQAVNSVDTYKKWREVHMTHCPECDADVSVKDLIVGEIVFCSDCNAELEVINVEQPEVALAPEVQEDWGE